MNSFLSFINISNLIFLFIFIVVIFIGYIKKVDCYKVFMAGAKEGATNTINMFSTLLTFTIAVTLLISSGVLDFIKEKLNFEYGIILIQSIVRPLSSSSSLSILIDIYEKEGVDSLNAILSTMIHYTSDASLYIIPFYLGMFSIKENNKLIILGVIVNIFSYIISIIIVLILFRLM